MAGEASHLLFELLIMLLQDLVTTLQRAIVDLDLLENRAGIIVFTQLLNIDWTIE